MGKDKGVTVVLNKILIYFGGVDITDDVVKALKNTQVMLGPGGEHAVGFEGALGDQVVHQHGHIRLGPGQYQFRLAGQGQGRVDGRPQPLPGGFFVSGGAVNLPGQIQPSHNFNSDRV